MTWRCGRGVIRGVGCGRRCKWFSGAVGCGVTLSHWDLCSGKGMREGDDV